jgi:hypothetical protein
VQIELTKEEADYVINALATRPYGEVFRLLEKIVGQVKQQIEPSSPGNSGDVVQTVQ